MQIVILNGAEGAGTPCDEAARLLEAKLQGQGTVRHFILRDYAIGHCLGEFDCWIRTPGRCRIKDEGQEIERAVHDADLYVLITPITFGGYGPELKKAVDRLIPLILPFFATRAGMTHHQHRYRRLPALLGVGVDALADAKLFTGIVENNAINLGVPSWSCAVLPSDSAQWDELLNRAIAESQTPKPASYSLTDAHVDLIAMLKPTAELAPLAHRAKVAILQASARAPGTSTSQSIADFLSGRLKEGGATVDIIPAVTFARGGEAAAAATRALVDADVLVVAAPLYVSSLPYLVVKALKSTLGRRAPHAAPQRVAGIINCGFPEPEHTRYAFGILRAYADQAGAQFLGGLSVSGGELIQGRPLDQAGFSARRIMTALESVAKALATGSSIPWDASSSLTTPPAPPVLYRFAGTMRWTWTAATRGLGPVAVHARPFDALSEEDWEREAAAGSARARPLRVVGKIEECPDAVTFLFEDPAHDPLRHEAGQYITLDMELDGARVRRAYSLASIPSEPGLAITVKRVPGGLMSNAIHDQLQPGDIVRTHGPAGRFTLSGAATPENGRVLLIGGGTGIVPLAAIARDALKRLPALRVVLLYGASSRDRAIYLPALEDLATHDPERFRLLLVLERADEDWQGPVGQLDEKGAGPLLDELDVVSFDRIMICGPDGMRNSVNAQLLKRAVDPSRIAFESFVSPRAAPASAETLIATRLADTGETHRIAVAPGQSVLEASLDAGEAISFSCMSGGCGACRITVVDGASNIALDEPNDVPMSDLRSGSVPACIARLRGPITFKVGA